MAATTNTIEFPSPDQQTARVRQCRAARESAIMWNMPWPSIEALETRRLRLEPLRVDHAVPMVGVLADPVLYEFIGGQRPTLSELQRRYAAQVISHPQDHLEWWLNWIVMLQDHRCAVGYVQATVEQRPTSLEANVAWVISPDFQARGLATEAAITMIDWLKAHGVEQFAAYIRPGNTASQAVARKLGLHPTTLIEDGEIRWQSARVDAAKAELP